MKTRKKAVGFAAGAALLAAGGASYGFSPPGYVEGFESDSDLNSQAVDYNPANPLYHTDATWASNPTWPGERPTQTAGPAYDDWTDIRGNFFGYVGYGGLIEEVPSGTEGVPSYNGSSHGMFMFAHGNVGNYYGGVISRSGRNVANPLGAGNLWAKRLHFYVNAAQPLTNNGLLDVTWDGSVYDTGGGVLIWDYNAYWDVATAAGTQNPADGAVNGVLVRGQGDAVTFIPNVVGEWLTMEVIFDPTIGANVHAKTRVWSGDEGTLLFDGAYTDMGVSSALMGGPRTPFWIFNSAALIPGSSSTDVVGWAIDDLVAGVAPLVVPEPASIGLLAAGGMMMLRRRRA